MQQSEPLPDGYLAIYQLAVEMADRISARRAIASSFFITAVSSLLVVVGLTTKTQWAFALPGLVLAISWWVLLKSYRSLNRAKFEVIRVIEKQLPISPFTDEWSIIKRTAGGRSSPIGKLVGRGGRYAELGTVEQVVPAVFGLVFAVMLASS